MKLQIEGNRLLDEMLQSNHRFTLHVGGSRSGKTYSILQVLCEYCLDNINCGSIITVVRKTLPALKGSAFSGRYLFMLFSLRTPGPPRQSLRRWAG